ncbi:Carbonic anhydrase or acetyltransferase, isoleucine patch superfamily [Fodinibius roseus]|uniref:Carbonic anhydrase or acetyltransferase, isoleucine patch superfamily n=1 Tax=Fodinibius roseus TaxID=1194090 RepID=A0A1M5HKU0_9BACT|nr:gamma carbonic anhydrase family protein [Fodinibius roseus]SHG16589.1 Carbonic anhydrase or acetyltransferase, isoleucine patch superfamily [Fodinibius roseus]
MYLKYREHKPVIHEDAYIAPNAVIRGKVSIGKGTRVLFGAVITDEGGPVNIGEDCVVMEQAVVRGTPRHAVSIGDSVLIGPHSHLSGCKIESNVFLATGSTIFNGVHIKVGSEVRINGIVHVNTVLEPNTTVPIGWVAVGNPAEILPPNEHNAIWNIQKQQDFPGTVWGVERSTPQGDPIRLYAKALQIHHQDEVVSSQGTDPE